jgi:hypothetical protein
MQYVRVSDANPAPVTVRATAGSTLEGRLVSESGEVVAGARVWAFPTDFDRSPVIGSGPAGLTMREDGTFRIAGVTGSRRIVLQQAPPGWYLRSAMVNGVDAHTTPFDFGLEERTVRDVEVVLASDGATLAGHAVDADGAAVADYSIVVFSTDRNQWFPLSQRLKAGRPSQDGSFRIEGLPPGEYWATAVDRLEAMPGAGEWQRPELLEQLTRRAQRLTIGGGTVRRVTLPLVAR